MLFRHHRLVTPGNRFEADLFHSCIQLNLSRIRNRIRNRPLSCGLVIVLLTGVMQGCQCCSWTEHWNSSIDHLADHEHQFDNCHDDRLDLTRINRPGGCSCRSCNTNRCNSLAMPVYANRWRTPTVMSPQSAKVQLDTYPPTLLPQQQPTDPQLPPPSEATEQPTPAREADPEPVGPAVFEFSVPAPPDAVLPTGHVARRSPLFVEELLPHLSPMTASTPAVSPHLVRPLVSPLFGPIAD